MEWNSIQKYEKTGAVVIGFSNGKKRQGVGGVARAGLGVRMASGRERKGPIARKKAMAPDHE